MLYCLYMKLTYKIDKKYDEAMIYEFLPPGGKNNKQGLADLLRLDSDDLSKLLKDKKLDLNKIIAYCVHDKYHQLLPYLKNSAADYQKSWDKINKAFFKMVASKTGQAWKYQEYFCVISAYHEGISSWGGNIIARRWSINADTQRKVTAHELVLSHFWTMLDNHDISKHWSEEQKWQYSEILSWCLLGLDPDFYKFWPWALKSHLFPINHQYHDLLPLQNKLKNLYLKSSDFPSFFEAALRLKK